jgi:uncharacterized membrane protein YqiK
VLLRFGHRYYLAAKESSGGFGMFGAPNKPAAPDTKVTDERKAAAARAAEQKCQDAEAKTTVAAEANRRKANETKMAAEVRRVVEANRAEAAAAADKKRKIAAAAAKEYGS